jgi:hypothetical protein
MWEELAQRQAQLAALTRDLRELDIIEQAEHVMRRHYQELLLTALEDIHLEMKQAQQDLGAARHCGNPKSDTVLAENRLNAIQVRAAAVIRHSRHEEQVAKHVLSVYAAQRADLQRQISGLKRLVRRIQSTPSR